MPVAMEPVTGESYGKDGNMAGVMSWEKSDLPDHMAEFRVGRALEHGRSCRHLPRTSGESLFRWHRRRVRTT
jgi:hypothetical protein